MAYSFTPSTLNITTFNQKSIAVYPNPTTSSWYFSTSNGNIKNIKIFDVLGKQIMKINAETIDASALSNGIYFAKVSTEDNSETIKLIKN